MSDNLVEVLKVELKKFYFKNFRRRGKSLKTLELIKECYNDQFDFYQFWKECNEPGVDINMVQVDVDDTVIDIDYEDLDVFTVDYEPWTEQ